MLSWESPLEDECFKIFDQISVGKEFDEIIACVFLLMRLMNK